MCSTDGFNSIQITLPFLSTKRMKIIKINGKIRYKRVWAHLDSKSEIKYIMQFFNDSSMAPSKFMMTLHLINICFTITYHVTDTSCELYNTNYLMQSQCGVREREKKPKFLYENVKKMKFLFAMCTL